MKTLLITTMMILTSTLAHANEAKCDQGILDVMNIKAKSGNFTDFRFSNQPKGAYVRLGEYVYFFENKDSQLEVSTLFGKNMVSVTELKEKCKTEVCEKGLNEILSSYKKILQRSKSEKGGMTAIRYSDNRKNAFVRVNDRVYFFNVENDGRLEYIKIFNQSSLSIDQLKDLCDPNNT